jgi:hypothetical protein
MTSLKGGPMWAALATVLAVIGASTALAYNGTLSGSLWLSVITPIIAAVTGVTAAHVTGNQVAAALNTPPPVPAAAVPTAAAPAAPGPAANSQTPAPAPATI